MAAVDKGGPSGAANPMLKGQITSETKPFDNKGLNLSSTQQFDMKKAVGNAVAVSRQSKMVGKLKAASGKLTPNSKANIQKAAAAKSSSVGAVSQPGRVFPDKKVK